MLSDEWLPRYRLLENFNKVEWNGNGNAYDRGDYNSSFALRAVELKSYRFGTNSFRFQAAKLWTSLPEEARKITDFNSFKSFIKGWNGTQ